MKQNLSRKRKRSNPKNNTSFSKEKKPTPPKSFQLNGFELIELSEKEEINPVISIEKKAAVEKNKAMIKGDYSKSKEYTRLRGKARNVETYYISKHGRVNIKENCFNCLMTDFNANELLYFNNRKDLMGYIEYCFFAKKRLFFFNKRYYLENKNEVMKFGNSFLNGWKFFIPKTMCKACFMQMLNTRLFATHLKSIFSDTDKNSSCKTNYRNYALFNPKFRSVFSLTKRMPNKRRSKRSRRLSNLKRTISNQKIYAEEFKKNDAQQNKSFAIKKNPDVIFNENNNTLTINKKILGDINIKVNDEKQNNMTNLNKEQKTNLVKSNIKKNDVKEKDKTSNKKKKEVFCSKNNSKNNKKNFTFTAKNETINNKIMEANKLISENVNLKTKEGRLKKLEPIPSIIPFPKSIIEQTNSFINENNDNDENAAKCISLCTEHMNKQINPLIKCIISYLNFVNLKLLDLIALMYFVNISIDNYRRKLIQNKNKNSESDINCSLNDFKSFYKGVEFTAIYYRRFSVISEFLFQKTSENLIQLITKLKKTGNNISLLNTIYRIEQELEQINLSSIFCNEKIEESVINFADNFRCFFALVNEMG